MVRQRGRRAWQRHHGTPRTVRQRTRVGTKVAVRNYPSQSAEGGGTSSLFTAAAHPTVTTTGSAGPSKITTPVQVPHSPRRVVRHVSRRDAKEYAGLKKEAGTERARRGQCLEVYVGGHTGGSGARKVRAVDFGDKFPFDLDDAVLRWYDSLLKGIGNGPDQEKPVRIFVMGKNEWRDKNVTGFCSVPRQRAITFTRPSRRMACKEEAR